MAGDEPLKMKRGGIGDPMFEATVAMVEAMQAAVADMVCRFPDPREGMSVAMTAGAMFAGAQAGQLMVIGAFGSQDKKRIIDSIAANARQGIDVGLRRGARIEAAEFGAGRA